MLGKFVAGQKSVTSNIFNELESNNWDVAMRLAHTLKGVSGNIGATNLQHLAGELEIAIKERRPRKEVDDRVNLLIGPLDHIISELEYQLTKTPQIEALNIHQETLQTVYSILEKLLADDDSEATEVWEKNANLFSAAFPGQYHKIDESIRSFNFETALLALRVANVTTAPQGSPNERI
jgi:two-component system sensor histidine kinase/response regulator